MAREKISNEAYQLWISLICVCAVVIRASATPSADGIFVSTVNLLPSLAVNSATNGQIQLALNAEAGIPHIVKSSQDLVNWMPAITNADNATNRLIVLPTSTDANFYHASRSPIPLFGYALAVKGYISLSGLGSISDSWNSHDTNQSVNGYYNGYAGTNGDIAVAAGGFASIGNKVVNGSIYLGPTATFATGPSGGITGQIHADCYLKFPDVALPTKDADGNNITWTPAPGNSLAHTFTSSGYYAVSDSGSLTVLPGVRAMLLVLSSSYSPAGLTVQGGTTNAGTLVMYQNFGTATFNGSITGGAINNRPENFIYLGPPGVSQITFGNISTFVGTVYAPGASVSLLSSGGPTEFIGSCIASNVTVNGSLNIHYDASLRTNWPCR